MSFISYVIALFFFTAKQALERLICQQQYLAWTSDTFHMMVADIAVPILSEAMQDIVSCLK